MIILLWRENLYANELNVKSYIRGKIIFFLHTNSLFFLSQSWGAL